MLPTKRHPACRSGSRASALHHESIEVIQSLSRGMQKRWHHPGKQSGVLSARYYLNDTTSVSGCRDCGVTSLTTTMAGHPTFECIVR